MNSPAREQFFNTQAAIDAQPVPGAYEALVALRREPLRAFDECSAGL